MSKIKNGGPAFPCEGPFNPDSSKTVFAYPGMSLRDWFAGQALRAIIEADGIQYASNVKAHATFAYEQADAMLAAREGGAS